MPELGTITNISPEVKVLMSVTLHTQWRMYNTVFQHPCFSGWKSPY